MSLNFRPLVVIPSRLAAERLPGKPLLDIAGKPMILHVWARAKEANIGEVIVAAGDQEIVDVIEAAGGKAVLTEPNLPSGTDRVWAAASIIDPQGAHDIIINLQGDLPTIDPTIIPQILKPFTQPEVDISTLASLIVDEEERLSPQVVKIAMVPDPITQIGRALYFSRNLIPHGEGPHYHHMGIYGFRRHALEKFVTAPSYTLEKQEKLEQLRALELGLRIDVTLVDSPAPGVDTMADLEAARHFFQSQNN